MTIGEIKTILSEFPETYNDMELIVDLHGNQGDVWQVYVSSENDHGLFEEYIEKMDDELPSKDLKLMINAR